MTSGFLSTNIFRGLAFRVLLFLSLALLPIGLIAVVQTREIADQSLENAELSLLAITEQASTLENGTIREAFGAAAALASVVNLIKSDDVSCSAFMREYQELSELYTVVSFITPEGNMDCVSTGVSGNVSDRDVFQKMTQFKTRMANVTDNPAQSSEPVMIVTNPLKVDDELIGFINLSVPLKSFDDAPEPEQSARPISMLTFNAQGDILTSKGALDTTLKELPSFAALKWYAGKSGRVFHETNQEGEERVYAVLPIVSGVGYAMSVWPKNSPLLKAGAMTRLSFVLPIAMWLASLIVAFWALNRLAIKHIRKLGRQMHHFALNRTLPRTTLGGVVPTEIVNMEHAFVGMAESILRDEAALEDNLRQKNILLKEVHHRVKNNLQLISSIMNMQIRQATTPDSKRVLQRLQDRILSLATVHKSLYQNDNLSRVDGGALMHEIVNQLLSVGLPSGSAVKVMQNYEAVQLDPDDAAPLTLLVSEAITNALKYVAADATGAGQIEVSLSHTQPEMALLLVKNTVGKGEVEDGTGLGSRLINAFSRQLNGQVEITEDDGLYVLRVEFHVPLQAKDVYDY
ncbi:MAG: sensor histidine kinase [Sulfitobacter litoralis]|uniref:histidine kinase n=1 Tax=Sulfitobacter litoralis TaxID=335975 RepID=A0ABY0RVV2_9RHOB|nr:sensor histidine kinase [Sulfitobacter litoralis]MBQ0767018.1 sensor histidine kinase [Sulfitobacter litoralis]MBQ0802608.1 sensor histidine kinase [Sulfitobacter litoralis]SDO53639.1 Two-component sensor histidine kinase, contains HisKA and HATPase domains [Sulfitobacter litoralis]|tara:strand:- start:173 stop:1894 length:1722 start_codon:yes stop_codon:yes gene_type:complete